MSAGTDVRRTNWWYVTPPASGRVLVIGDDDHGDGFASAVVVRPQPGVVAEALRDGPFTGVAVPDLDALTAAAGAPMLARLAAGVAGDGWLYAGFSNRSMRSGGLSVGRARRALRAAGFDHPLVYLAAPDHLTPAYLIPAVRRAEVDYFLRMLFFPYSEATGPRGAATRTALRFLRAGAGVSPPWLRTLAWPSVALVATRRPA